MNVLTIFQILPCVRQKKGKNLIFRYLWTSRRFSRNLWHKILDFRFVVNFFRKLFFEGQEFFEKLVCFNFFGGSYGCSRCERMNIFKITCQRISTRDIALAPMPAAKISSATTNKKLVNVRYSLLVDRAGRQRSVK